MEGEIEKLYVDDGDDVVKGQKLLEIDKKQIQEEYNQAQANCEAAKADMERAEKNIPLSVNRLRSNILLAENTLRSAQADLEGAKARTTQQLSQANLAITSMKSLLEQDEIALRKIELALEQAESSRKTAKATLDNAKAELDRKTELHKKKFVSLREVETTQLQYASALSQYELAVKSVESQQENLKSQPKIIENRKATLKAEIDDLVTLKQSINEQLEQAQIQIQQAKERLDLLKKSEEGETQLSELAKASANANLLRAKSVLKKAEERLEWTTVTAPMAGKIIQCGIEEGEIITSGRSAWSQGPPVMIIADLSKMIVKAYIHENDIDKVMAGQKAEIRINAYRDEVFEGEVKEIAPSGQLIDSIIKFEVMVIVTKADKPLLPGMTADVDIIFDARDNVLQLPLEAVIPRDTIKVRTDIKQDITGKLKGQEVRIVLNNYPDKEFDGRVAEIAPPRPGFSTSEVTVIMKGSPKELQPETSRSAEIVISDNEKIPNIEARIDSETEYFVKLVKEDESEQAPESKDKDKNRKKRRNKKKRNEEDKMIEVGERTQSNIEILDGLKEGDKVRVVPVGEEEEEEEKK